MTTPLCQWSGRAQAAGGCFKIQGADQRNACLAREKGDRGYCFKIQSDDLQKDCLANTPR